jgi:hypothetical protein
MRNYASKVLKFPNDPVRLQTSSESAEETLLMDKELGGGQSI